MADQRARLTNSGNPNPLSGVKVLNEDTLNDDMLLMCVDVLNILGTTIATSTAGMGQAGSAREEPYPTHFVEETEYSLMQDDNKGACHHSTCPH